MVEALREFTSFRRLLHEELGATPSAQMVCLASSLASRTGDEPQTIR